MEDLQAKHRKEQEDLESRLAQKKKNATKKTRRRVEDECEVMKRDLLERQQSELEALNPESLVEAVEGLEINGPSETPEEILESPEKLPKKVAFEQPPERNGTPATTESVTKPKKPNRQKARLARRAAEQEAMAEAAAEEASNLPDLREQEMEAMGEHMKKLGLKETFIQPDGHCLYSACAHGLPDDSVLKAGVKPYQNVRIATADYISSHPDDFAPFLEEPLDSYVVKIKDTAEWGGQLELQAISQAYGININVLQADGRIEKIQSNQVKPANKDKDVWLSYYRHSFGLGEHYNSLTKAT